MLKPTPYSQCGTARDGECVVSQPGLNKFRAKNGELCKKHGSKLIATLTLTYGGNFAPGLPAHMKLSDVLHELDEASLRKLVNDLQEA